MKRENSPSEVIGVVGDVKHAGLDAENRPTAYWAFPELSFSFMTGITSRPSNVRSVDRALR